MGKIKLRVKTTFNGNDTKKNGIVSLKFVTPYSELSKVIALYQLVNLDFKLYASTEEDNEKVFLGMFRINRINTDKDGETKLTFSTDISQAKTEIFSGLAKHEGIIMLYCLFTDMLPE